MSGYMPSASAEAHIRHRLQEMLVLQDTFNRRVDPNWKHMGWSFTRAVWLECGELMEHIGWKWWKHQEMDLGQAKMEIIDIWHFALAFMLLDPHRLPHFFRRVMTGLEVVQNPPDRQAMLHYTEKLAGWAAHTGEVSTQFLIELTQAAGMSFDDVYRAYVSKNVLNAFRQDHGYKAGTYIKQWGEEEDNQVLTRFMGQRPTANYEELYEFLKAEYAVWEEKARAVARR